METLPARVAALEAQMTEQRVDTSTIEAAILNITENQEEMSADVKKMLQGQAEMAALIRTEPDRCKYRERIAKAANNTLRLERVEGAVEKLADRVTDVRIGVAKVIAVGGGSGAVVAAIVSELVKKIT